MITRRNALKGAAMLPLAAPSIAAAESARVMTFVPQSELNSIDPAWIPAANVRTHGYLVFDTLYGIDDHYRAARRRWSKAPAYERRRQALATAAAARVRVPRRHAGAGARLRRQHQRASARATAWARR